MHLKYYIYSLGETPVKGLEIRTIKGLGVNFINVLILRSFL